jgi:hypothetical protein
MKLKTVLLATLLLTATSAFADQKFYRFKASWVTDHLAFVSTGGTEWKTLTPECPKGTECEVNVGRKADGTEADFAISRVKNDTLRLRCLREGGCNVIILAPGARNVLDLNKGAVADFASGALVAFNGSSHPSSGNR